LQRFAGGALSLGTGFGYGRFATLGGLGILTRELGRQRGARRVFGLRARVGDSGLAFVRSFGLESGELGVQRFLRRRAAGLLALLACLGDGGFAFLRGFLRQPDQLGLERVLRRLFRLRAGFGHGSVAARRRFLFEVFQL